MGRIRRVASRALVALLLVTLGIPGGVLDPDPDSVAAAALRTPEQGSASAPASPGVYRSASSATSTPITSISVNKPTGTATNDVLIAAITVRGTPTITAPSGWTLIRSDANSTTLTQALYRKVASASCPASRILDSSCRK